MMTLHNFVALAKFINLCNERAIGYTPFGANAINCLADFCESQNKLFNRERWLMLVRGDIS